MTAGIRIEPLRRHHHDDLVTAAWNLRTRTGLYPPPQDCSDSRSDIERWWTNRTDQVAWAAVRDGAAIGHVAVAAPGPHLDRFCSDAPYLEITGLYVNPDHARIGAGSLLLHRVRAHCHAEQAHPILAVVATWRPAVALYLHAGMTLAGGFHGRHGVNLVFSG